jgi:hypothetical protein
MASNGSTPARARTITELKASMIMRPALTNNFEVYVASPPNMGKALSLNGVNLDTNRLILSCSEASLPGSSIATHEITNDHTGVTERHGYRRLYDDKADFTFYVDSAYYQIKFFETWLRYIVNENVSSDLENNITNNYYSYRVNWPDDYQTSDLYITKFEKDLGAVGQLPAASPLTYRFIQAFPTNITSMPVSYETASLLKVTVSFSYSRYFIQNSKSISQTTPQPNATGNPELNTSNQTNNPGGTVGYNGLTKSTVVTNEYYNNFGQRSQDATNTANFLGVA